MKTAKKLSLKPQNVRELIHDYFFGYMAENDEVFEKHCEEMTNFMGEQFELWQPHEMGHASGVKHFVHRTAMEKNIPFPIKEFWVDSPKYDFHYFCANVFWPAAYRMMQRLTEFLPNVVKEKIRKPKHEKLQDDGDDTSTNAFDLETKLEITNCCNLCNENEGKYFETPYALNKHKANAHDIEIPLDDEGFDSNDDELNLSDPDYWTLNKCKFPKCEKICLTNSAYEYHLRLHQEYPDYFFTPRFVTSLTL